MRTFFAVLLLIGLVAGGAAAYQGYFSTEAPGNFRTGTIERGDLLITITATGTLESEELVDVGAQVVGRIKEFGLDPRGETNPRYKDKIIESGSPVHERMLLAQIDDSLYVAAFNQAQAALERAKADLIQLQAKRDQTDAEWKRAQRLHELKLSSLSSPVGKESPTSTLTIQGISDSDFILAKANYEVALANVEVGKAAIKQEEAMLQQVKTNLDYTTIKSPVEGTIIDRRVNIGQTVVSSLNAPSLFLIAKDLRKMQVWASVNEADIGRLKEELPVTFTVDAFPNEVFHGKVSRIRLNATMTQNVVTYTVVVSFDNSDMKLIPYLTANVNFEIDRRSNALLVPNAALRWQPRLQQVAPDVRDSAAASSSGKRQAKEKPAAEKSSDAAGKKSSKPRQQREERGVVWVKDEDFVRPVEVRVGSSDGTATEISGPEVKEGMEVVLSEIRSERSTDTKNPFAPKFFRGSGKGTPRPTSGK